MCWAIWKCHNRACFDQKMIKSPIEIIIHAGSFMSYWSSLYSFEFQGKLADSIKVLMGVAYKLLAQQVAPSIAGQTGRTAQHGTGTVLARHGRHGQHFVPCRASPRADLQARARLLEAIGVPCRAPGMTCQSMARRASKHTGPSRHGLPENLLQT